MTDESLPRGTSQSSETSHTSQKPDYSTWLTKQQAADAIGVSTKTIEQWAIEGKLQRAVWRLQGRGAQKAVYHPDDVARIASERRGTPSAFVLPVGVTSPVNGNGHPTGITPLTPLTGSPSGEDILRLVFAAALQRLTVDPPDTSQSSQNRLFLTLAEAVALSGLSAWTLRQAMIDGKLPCTREPRSHWTAADRGWRIRRKDLEAL